MVSRIFFSSLPMATRVTCLLCAGVEEKLEKLKNYEASFAAAETLVLEAGRTEKTFNR